MHLNWTYFEALSQSFHLFSIFQPSACANNKTNTATHGTKGRKDDTCTVFSLILFSRVSRCFVRCTNLPNYKPCNTTKLPPTQHRSTTCVCKQQNKVCLRNFQRRFKLQLSAAGLVRSHVRGREHQTKAATALWERALSGSRSLLLTVTPTKKHLFLTETRCDDTHTHTVSPCLLDYHRVLGSTLSFGILSLAQSFFRKIWEGAGTYAQAVTLQLSEPNINVEEATALWPVLIRQL